MVDIKFIVFCERIPRRKWYYLRFPINEQLITRIKNLPSDSRKWNAGMMCWEVNTLSLYSLIKKYKGSTKIHFDFGSEESRQIFIDNIRKIEITEIDKRKFIAELNIKKEEWVKYKEELETTYVDHYDKLHSFLKEGIKLYPHQIIAALFMTATKNALISHEMGLGKAQDLDSKLLTINGWVRMGDIKVGDYVIGSDGKPKKILAIYPQGVKLVYNIGFNDNTFARSCDEHLWNVNNGIGKSFSTKTLRKIIDGGLQTKNGNNKWNIPIVKPIEFGEKKLKIEPYVLGQLIGGNQNLEYFDLNNVKLVDRFVPHDYMYSSIQQRLEFLQGVLDNNGFSENDSIIKLTLNSKKLIKDIQFIVQSLGGIGKIVNNGYYMEIELPPVFAPFKSKEKIKSFIPPIKYVHNREIESVTCLGERECQCILIDSDDHLYVTDNCVLTHNTLSSILYIEMNGFEKVFVITPNSLKFNYYGEVKKFTNSNAHIVNWKKNDCSIEDAKYVIVNYDYFNPSNKAKFITKWKKLGIDYIDAVICDEAQKLKNTKSNTYKNFKSTFKKSIFRKNKISKIFLSGTPAPNRAHELYTIMNQISEVDFATKKHFYEYYCGMTYDIGDGWGYTVNTSEQKFEELYHKIAPFTHRKRKGEVLTDLPDKTYQRIILEMTDDEQRIYDEIESGVANEFVENPNGNPLTTMIRLRQYLATIKVRHVVEIIENIFESGEKVVVVDYFKDSLYELNKRLGNVSALHTGDQEVEERAEIVNKFQDMLSELRAFLGSIQTCNYGLTLTAASKLFVMTLPFSVGEFDQVSDRLHRIGQKSAVNIYVLIFPETIDDYVFSSIEGKRKEIVKVIDNEDYESNIDDSIMSEVIKKIKEKHGK